MNLKRPEPVQCGLDDLVGQKVLATAEINDRFDDRILYGVRLEDGRVWTSSMGDDDQEDRCFVELGLWTAEEAKQYRRAVADEAARQYKQLTSDCLNPSANRPAARPRPVGARPRLSLAAKRGTA